MLHCTGVVCYFVRGLCAILYGDCVLLCTGIMCYFIEGYVLFYTGVVCYFIRGLCAILYGGCVLFYTGLYGFTTGIVLFYRGLRATLYGGWVLFYVGFVLIYMELLATLYVVEFYFLEVVRLLLEVVTLLFRGR